MSQAREPGKREQNKADKQRRIRAAARQLFSSRGYSSVTTQEVADTAEVGTGTLFRYAQSKAELLCMVANEDLRAMVETVPDTGDPVEDLVRLCEPLIIALDNQPENIAAYHRETLFGEPGPHRSAAQTILQDVREIIAVILARHGGQNRGQKGHSREGDEDPGRFTGPAQTVFDVMYMTIVRSGVERTPGRDSRGELREQVGHVLNGALPSMRSSPAAGPTPGAVTLPR